MEKVDNYAIIENYLMIKMPDEVDHHKAADICRMADAYITHSRVENIVFDFEDTEFMDSSGIGVIMGRYKLVKGRGGEITVTNINQAIDRIFTISGLYKLVNKKETTSLAKW